MRAAIYSAALALAMMGTAHANDCNTVATELARATVTDLKQEMEFRPLIAESRGTEIEADGMRLGMDYVERVTKLSASLRALMMAANCEVVDPDAQRRADESFRVREASVKRIREAMGTH